jgi:hypothetical protein
MTPKVHDTGTISGIGPGVLKQSISNYCFHFMGLSRTVGAAYVLTFDIISTV